MRTLQEIIARMDAIQAELAGIAALPEPEGDDDAARSQTIQDRSDLSDELLAEWDELDGERKPLAARQERLDAVRAAVVGAHNQERGSFEAPNVRIETDTFANLNAVRAGVVPGDSLRDRALKAIETAPRHVDDKAKEHMTRLIEDGGTQSAAIARHMLLTGSPEYHEQFKEYMDSSAQYMGPALRAALALSPSTAGGALVPFTLDPTIILTNAGIVDPIRSIAHVEQIATNAWNGVTSAGVNAAFVAENSAVSDGTPTVAAKAIPVYKAAAWVFGSWEILGDSNFGTQLPRLIADAKARLEGGKFAVGSGSGEPTGVVTAVKAQTTSRVAAGTAGAFGVADVFAVSNAMEPRYSQNASWLGNKSVYNVIRQFSTVTSGGAFWTDLGMGRPANLIGASAYEVSSMNAYATATNTDLLLAADMSMYYIIDRVGLSLTFDQNIYDTTTGRPLGQSGWVAWWRVGGDMTDPGAGRLVRPFTTTSNWV